MVAHHAQSVGIPPPVALTMMIVGRWTWGRSAYRWTKSAATMALAIRAKSLSASVMRSLGNNRNTRPSRPPVPAHDLSQMSQSAVAWRLSPFNGLQGSRLRAIFVAKTDQMADNLPHNPEHPGKDRFYPRCGGDIGENGHVIECPCLGIVSGRTPQNAHPGCIGCHDRHDDRVV